VKNVDNWNRVNIYFFFEKNRVNSFKIWEIWITLVKDWDVKLEESWGMFF
jgi:hypothetical protein